VSWMGARRGWHGAGERSGESGREGRGGKTMKGGILKVPSYVSTQPQSSARLPEPVRPVGIVDWQSISQPPMRPQLYQRPSGTSLWALGASKKVIKNILNVLQLTGEANLPADASEREVQLERRLAESCRLGLTAFSLEHKQ
jgi:hypothetical protein